MGDPSRWNNERELEWVELRPELVVEVTFDHVSNDRIRHGTKVSRWRDDKDPRDCTDGSSSKTNCVSLWAMPVHRITPPRLRQRLPRRGGRRAHARRHACSRAPRSAILAAAEALGAPIRRIALTHAHGDHIGSLDALARRAAGRRGPDLARATRDCSPRTSRSIRASRRTSCAAATGREDRGRRGRSRRATASARSRSTPRPGHTPGQVAFLDTRDRTLYCADAYSTLGGVATTAKANWRFPLPALGDVAQADRARDRAGAARARPRTARARPRQGRRAPGAAMDRAIARGA